jgi:hypothetical protein
VYLSALIRNSQVRSDVNTLNYEVKAETDLKTKIILKYPFLEMATQNTCKNSENDSSSGIMLLSHFYKHR